MHEGSQTLIQMAYQLQTEGHSNYKYKFTIPPLKDVFQNLP